MMDADLSSMLSGILNNPQEMEKLKSMANNLFGGETGLSSAPPPPQNPTSFLGDVSPDDIAGIMKIVGALKNNVSDQRVNLLVSLKPHLSEKRQKRVDDAVKILRLISLLPMLKELNIFGGI
ncbi:MAG: hypothetical protein IJ944_06245 [Clostridia bacterium]|nr:hypothetical protein [Clostridia bacterium]